MEVPLPCQVAPSVGNTSTEDKNWPSLTKVSENTVERVFDGRNTSTEDKNWPSLTKVSENTVERVFDGSYVDAVGYDCFVDVDDVEELINYSARRQLYKGYAKGKELHEDKVRRSVRNKRNRLAEKAQILNGGVPVDALRGRHTNVRRLIKCGYMGDGQGTTTFISHLRN